MLRGKKVLFNKKTILGLIVLYFFINIIFLTKFPFVHSDESWLSGLSRNILEEQSYSVTESFFDLYERNPHAIKIFFHSLQIVFLKVFGYNIFTFRLISLIFAILSLVYFYKLSKVIFNSKNMAFVACVLLAIDIQFIYAAHFARQEIIILFVLILGIYYFMKNIDSLTYKKDLILGVIIGLSIGIHPNSFIISLPFVFIYLYHILITKKANLKDIIVYGFTLFIFALLFVFLSLYFDNNFFYNYAKFGDQFGVLNPVNSKIGQLKYFYLKLYHGVSGTYYTPNIRFQFFLFPIVFLLSLVKILIRKSKEEREKVLSIVLAIIAINTGIIIIGRFNQTSIIFVFPLFYLLLVYILHSLSGKLKCFSILILVSIILIFTFLNIYPFLNTSYSRYLENISRVVKKDDTVLANLNTEYYFENGKLYDYRNLVFLKENKIDFAQYIYDNKIQYIIYPEEMDFIYDSTPKWNGLYGNVSYYYRDMKRFFEDDCELVDQFNDGSYGIRIVRHMNEKDWKIKVYKVKNQE